MSQWNQFQQGGAYGDHQTVYVAMIHSDDHEEVAGFSLTEDGAKQVLAKFIEEYDPQITGRDYTEIDGAVIIKTQFGKTYQDGGLFNEDVVHTMMRNPRLQYDGSNRAGKPLYAALIRRYDDTVDDVYTDVAGLSMTLNGAKTLISRYVRAHSARHSMYDDDITRAYVVKTQFGKSYATLSRHEEDVGHMYGLAAEPEVYTYIS